MRTISDEILLEMIKKYEISAKMAQKLEALKSYKIVFIFDDSTSMKTMEINILTRKISSRWDELLEYANRSIEIASAFNPNGCDVHFLNKPAIKNVNNIAQIADTFRERPRGFTPLVKVIQTVINENPQNLLNGKKLLLIITTDGEPTDEKGDPNIPEFKECLKNRPDYVFTNIIACTDDQSSIGYLNGLDKEYARLDVIDDYKSELTEILNVNGADFVFTFGDYITKSMIGSIDSDLDRLDENKTSVVVREQFQDIIIPTHIIQNYHISLFMLKKLNLLKSFKIVFIYDDSTSMKTMEINILNKTVSTRWDELLEFANTSIVIATLFNSNGCDVHFLNRPVIRNVNDSKKLVECFRTPPRGVTPLTRTINTVIDENPKHMLNGKKLLLIVTTDGEPTNVEGDPGIPEFKECLKNRPDHVFTTIVACTDDESSIGYLNGIDKEFERLDVVDDYKSELAEIKKFKGADFPFSYGDYVIKSMLGSIDPELDKLDEI